MNLLESTTIRTRKAGAIELELCSFAPTRSVTRYTNGTRAILGLSLPPYPGRKMAGYTELGDGLFDLGNIILTPPGADCRFSGDNRPSFALRCYFDEAIFQRVARMPDIWPDDLLMKTFDIAGGAGARIDYLLRQMIREIEAPGFAAETLIEGLGITALAHLSRHLNGENCNDSAPVRGRLSRVQLQRIESFVEGTRGRSPTITELAAECGIGPRRFTSLFRAATGQTVKDWITERRMNLACRMLAETDVPLKAIAFDLGFASPSAFSTAFRLHSGISPREYRRELRHSL